jgi:hypothetical protein
MVTIDSLRRKFDALKKRFNKEPEAPYGIAFINADGTLKYVLGPDRKPPNAWGTWPSTVEHLDSLSSQFGGHLALIEVITPETHPELWLENGRDLPPIEVERFEENDYPD